MAAKKSPGKLDDALAKAIAAELTEAQRRHEDDVYEDPPPEEGASGVRAGQAQVKPPAKKVASKGDFVYPFQHRMAVLDRALKLEQLKLKIDDPEWGKAFGKGD